MSIKFKQIKETCIYVRDLDSIYDFYCRVLELPVITFLKDKHLFLRVGKFCSEGKQHFAFEVADVGYDYSKQIILAKGIRITEEVTWKSGKKSFYFEDPAGNVLEIVPDKKIWD